MLNSIVNTYSSWSYSKAIKIKWPNFLIYQAHLLKSLELANNLKDNNIVIIRLPIAVTCSCRPQGQFEWNNIKPQYTDLLAQWKAKQLLGILRYPFLNIIFLFNFK